MSEETKSLSPVGTTMPIYLKRLDDIPADDPRRDTDAEWIMVRLWAEANTPKPCLNGGTVPLDNILHNCSDQCGKSNLSIIPRMHSYVRPLNPEHVKIAAAVVQWLATNVGRGFLAKFDSEFKKANKAPEAEH